ncbi:MAG TPA: TerC family protein [Gemmatimonadaceae bacterium]|nr:TerC family protein [Gemmatimonadaceae bacterium]
MLLDAAAAADAPHVATNLWFWVGFNAFVLAMLALDLGVFNRKAHVITPKEAGTWTAVWVTLALLFAAGLHWYAGTPAALTFLTGYVIEEALSVDNIFVIVLIFAYFKVPAKYQHRVLFWGILGALVMRGTFIALGTLLITRFHWVLYVFGALLVFTGVRMAVRDDDSFDGDDNAVARFVRRVIPLAPRIEGKHFFLREDGRPDGRWLASPLLLVLVMVEVTDLVFAIDSIPAIFSITRDPFLVYTSNIFAVLGLRSLYFLLAHVVERFYLLRYGLAVILVFIGVKMLGESFFHVPIGVSLAVIAGVLALSIGGSLAFPTKETGKR